MINRGGRAGIPGSGKPGYLLAAIGGWRVAGMRDSSTTADSFCCWLYVSGS
jgi:hypothetical protein